MSFLENFEQQCRLRGESPSHALEAAGLSRSLLTKWRNRPDRVPYGITIQKLANYFGCSFDSLDDTGRSSRYESDELAAVKNCIYQLNDDQLKYLLSFLKITYPEKFE